MRTVPRNQSPKISFFKSRLVKWNENAEQIGVSPEDVALLSARTDAARVALSAQRAAQMAAEAATLKLQIAMDEMATQGAAMLLQIRAKARMSGNNRVYSLAQIATPKKGSPIGVPGKPNRFEFMVDDLGALRMTWQCKNPRGSTGTIYQIYRRIGGSGEMTFLGTSGKKRFVDTTLPIGASSIMYQIRAVRSTKVGEAATFNVNFGVSRGTPVQMRAA